jgi:phosphate:Na+ symporter
MYGMQAMSDAVSPLADQPKFIHMLTMFSNPALGCLAGALLQRLYRVRPLR